MKIAIIGKMHSKFYAPYWDKDWQIWGCNKHKDFATIPRYDLWFDIHKHPQAYPEIPQNKLILRDNNFIEWCNKELGGNYLNGSIAYMLMYAIKLGATEISLYGCGFYLDSEVRGQQLQNVRELLFYCKGKGIKVYSIEESLTKEYEIYG